MSGNLAVTSQTGVSDTDLGVEFSWAPAAGLTATAREALVKAVARVPPAWLLAPREGELRGQMRPAEVIYLNNHWVPKESQVVRLYTQRFPNLGCFTTQRDESIHPVVKTLLNPQIRLDQAVSRLFEEMTRFIDRIAKAEMSDQLASRLKRWRKS